MSACLASFLTAALVGGIAAASVVDGSGMINACYNQDTGALRVIDPDSPHDSCLDTDKQLSWSQQSFRWLGPWHPSNSYVVGDAVAFEGSSYLAIADNPSVPDPEGGACGYEGDPNHYLTCGVQPGVGGEDYWNVLAIAGSPGEQGVEGPRGLRGAEGPRGPAGSGGGSSTPTGIAGYQIVSKRSSTNDDTRHAVGVDCPNGKQALGGGAHISIGADAYVVESFPQAALFNQKGWFAAAESQDTFPDDWFLEVYAICAKV